MRDIDMKICRCGRIHFYDNKLLSKLLEDDKELVIICSRCGRSTHIGANKEPAIFYDDDADENDTVFDMYSYVEEQEEFTKDDFVKPVMEKQGKRTIGKIIVDVGIGVPMETGFNATLCNSSCFADTDSTFEIRKSYSTLHDLESDMLDYNNKRTVVNMKLLVSRLSDEQADVLSDYMVAGLDWSDTKFANKY